MTRFPKLRKWSKTTWSRVLTRGRTKKTMTSATIFMITSRKSPSSFHERNVKHRLIRTETRESSATAAVFFVHSTVPSKANPLTANWSLNEEKKQWLRFHHNIKVHPRPALLKSSMWLPFSPRTSKAVGAMWSRSHMRFVKFFFN